MPSAPWPEPAKSRYDAIVVGSGPNGMAAAVTLGRAGLSVLVVEASATLGGGTRSAELTLPGFVHDVCSAIHPMGAASPFFRTLPLEAHGLRWVHPQAPLAHPLDGGACALLERSLDATVEGLGKDGPAYRRLLGPLVDAWEPLFADTMGPLRFPKNPILLARFGARAVWPATWLARACFSTEAARGLFAGVAAHAVLPLDAILSSAVGLMLSVAGHAVGWPMAAGGSQRITEALSSYLASLGGEVLTNAKVSSLAQLPPARAVFFDTIPRDLARIAGERLPAPYREALGRFRHGPAVFKLDWALDGPIPWTAEGCRRAGTLHLGPTLADLALAEKVIWQGKTPEVPYVLLAQHTLFDPTRAPDGKHTAWAYCHVPHGNQEDMTARIEAQVERFAPGFGRLILARHVTRPSDFARYNANYVGGDITGGVVDLRQLFTRPTARVVPYSTPAPGIYLCSSSTPPGPGVHGMCGFFAAEAALRVWDRLPRL